MERLPVVSCQWRLAWAWFIGAGLTFLLLLTQTTSGKYGEQYTKVWSWFLPTVVPTLTLVIGALVYDAKDKLISVFLICTQQGLDFDPRRRLSNLTIPQHLAIII